MKDREWVVGGDKLSVLEQDYFCSQQNRVVTIHFQLLFPILIHMEDRCLCVLSFKFKEQVSGLLDQLNSYFKIPEGT